MAPPDLAVNLRTWSMLPAPCREGFWDLLLPNLAPEIDERLSARVQALMKEYGVRPAQLSPSMSALRLLLRTAARFAVTQEDFSADCAALLGDDLELRSLVQGWYDKALPLLRQELEESSLIEHGNTASDLSWRVSMVTRSQRGVAINRAIATFTFDYVEGRQQKSFTLNMLPDTVVALRDACNEIIEPTSAPD